MTAFEIVGLAVASANAAAALQEGLAAVRRSQLREPSSPRA